MARVSPRVSLKPAGRFGYTSGRESMGRVEYVLSWLWAPGVEWMDVPSVVSVTNDGFVVVPL